MILSIALSILVIGFIFVIVTICRILYSILFPTIIPYPWPIEDHSNNNNKNNKKDIRTVVFAGSFNPIHLGHLSMIQYLSYKYTKVIIVIGCNPKKFYIVTPQQRADLIRKVIRTSNNHQNMIRNVFVQVVSNDYIWRIVQRQGATLFIRGIRTWEQDGNDEQRLQFQNIYGPILLGPLWYPIPTLFLQGIPKYNHISSTYLRNLIQQYNTNTNTNNTSNTNTKEQQQQQNDKLKLILKQKLYTLVPESIVDDIIQLYGK